MRITLNILSITLALFLLSACSAGPGATLAPVEKRDGDLWVRLASPQDQMIVKTAQVDVRGQAPEETTISINDDISLIGPDQIFVSTVPLKEGPNSIEIVASNMSGNEVSFNLTVIYQP
jgi:hypothetical protein